MHGDAFKSPPKRFHSEMVVILILGMAIAALVLWPIAKFVAAYYVNSDKGSQHLLESR